MFSSLLSNLFETNMNFLSSIFGDDVSVGNNVTSDEMTDDCSLADDLEMNRVSNNLLVVPVNESVNELTEVITDELSEVTSDEMSGFDDDKEFYPNNL